jgi:Protein of unknown function (DUF2950)
MDAKRDTPKGLMTMRRTLLVFALAVSFLSLSSVPARSQSDAGAPAKTPAQMTFPTPDAAVDAMIKGLEDYDVPELLKIFGPSGEVFISSADPVRDKNAAINFARIAREKHTLQINPSKPNRAILVVGDSEFPFPVPIVKTGGKWLFDTAAGRKEILYRRIGANELDAIQVCRGYVEAQDQYASTIHDNSGVNQYAQKVISTPGKQDGLYWENADGTPGGPISEPVAKALAEGYTLDKKGVYHGYYFKILKGQGPAAPLGKLDYLIQDAMIGGFAMVAVPAEYRVTGVKTFIVGPQGIVFQKDLGPDSLKIAKDMELFDPDKTWQETDDQWPGGAANTQVAADR